MGFGPGGMGGGGPGMGPGMGMGGMAGSARPSMRKALVVFENSSYRYLWFSNVAGFTGMQMQQVARGLLAWQLTHSFAAVGVVSLSFGLPMLFLSLIGGAVADRVDKRNLAMRTQFGVGLIALATAILVATDTITIEFLFIVGLLQGTLFAFSMPARMPLMAEVVPETQLMSAIALGNAAMNATRLVGPAVAGALIGVWGIESAYFVQAFMYMVSVLLYLGVPAGRGGGFGLARRSGVFSEIGEGLRYVVGNRTIRLLLFMAFVPTMFGMPYIMLLPGFVQQGLGRGASDFGFLLTVSGAGALVGSLAVATLSDFPWKPLLQVVMGVAAGLALVLLGVASTAFGYTGALAAIVVLGLAFTTYQTLNMTMVMAASKPEYYGRVMSIYMLTFSVMPLMAAPLGVVADRVGGAANVFVGQGMVIAVFMALVAVANPRYIFSRVSAAPAFFGGRGMGMGGQPGGAGPRRAAEQGTPVVAARVAEQGTPVVAARVAEQGTPVVAARVAEQGTPVVAARVAEQGTPVVAARVAEQGTPVVAARAAEQAAPVVAVRTAEQATPVVATSNGDSASPAVPVAASAARASGRLAPVDYMGGAEQPRGHDYMANGHEIASRGNGSAQQRRQPGWLTGYGLTADATNGTSAMARRAYGLEASPVSANGDGAARAEPAAVGNAPAPASNEPARPGPEPEPAAYVSPGIETIAERQHSTPDPGPAERVNIPVPPPRGRAGMLERSLVAAVTATVVTRALSSVLRSPPGRR